MLQILLQICNRFVTEFVTSSFEGVESIAWRIFSSCHQNTIQTGPYATQKYSETSNCPRDPRFRCWYPNSHVFYHWFCEMDKNCAIPPPTMSNINNHWNTNLLMLFHEANTKIMLPNTFWFVISRVTNCYKFVTNLLQICNTFCNIEFWEGGTDRMNKMLLVCYQAASIKLKNCALE